MCATPLPEYKISQINGYIIFVLPF